MASKLSGTLMTHRLRRSSAHSSAKPRLRVTSRLSYGRSSWARLAVAASVELGVQPRYTVAAPTGGGSHLGAIYSVSTLDGLLTMVTLSDKGGLDVVSRQPALVRAPSFLLIL